MSRAQKLQKPGGKKSPGKKAKGKGRKPFNPHTREGKDILDRKRARRALRRGLDLGKVLWVVLGEGKQGAQADAALRRLQRALKNRQLGVGWRSHLDQAILKHLVGEGYLRPEKKEVRKGEIRAWKRKRRDERFGPWVFYRITNKGKKLLEAYQEKEAAKARVVPAGGGEAPAKGEQVLGAS